LRNIINGGITLPFAGHPTLGTAFLIRKEILRKDVKKLTLNLGLGADLL